jgi:hypothetical protein
MSDKNNSGEKAEEEKPKSPEEIINAALNKFMKTEGKAFDGLDKRVKALESLVDPINLFADMGKMAEKVADASIGKTLRDLQPKMQEEVIAGARNEVERNLEALKPEMMADAQRAVDEAVKPAISAINAAVGPAVENIKKYALAEKNRVVNEAEDELDKSLKNLLPSYRKARNIIIGGAVAAVIFAVAASVSSLYRTYKMGKEDVPTIAAKLEEEKTKRTTLETMVKVDKGNVSDWQKAHNDAKKNEDETRKKDYDGLESRLKGEIAKKADSSAIEARFADMSKAIGDINGNYDALNGIVQGELKKNAGREEAYAKYKEISETIRGDFTKLGALVEGFRKEVYTKEETDAKLAETGNAIVQVQKDLVQYKVMIDELTKSKESNSEEIARINRLYENLETQLRKYIPQEPPKAH